MGMHVTVKQKILLHLMRFNVTPETGFTVAYDITQDGIASVIGVTRAHVSVELKRMTEDGRLICWKAHLAGSSIKRLAYAVTPRGLSEAETIQKTLLENGIIPEMLLDMNGCSPGDLWNTLDEADRDVLGMVCVLRRRIPRNDLPKMSNATLPVDMEGLVSIPKAAARNYLTYASAARTRAWNSWAAEYWLSHNDYVERLYHLTMAGRMREASRCLSIHKNEILDHADNQMLRVVKKILPEPETAAEVFRTGAEMALKLNKTDDAGRMCARLATVSEHEWKPIMAEVYRRNGKRDEAYKLAMDSMTTKPNPHAALVLARIAVDDKDLDTAETYIDKAAVGLSHTGDARLLDEIHRVRASVDELRESEE